MQSVRQSGLLSGTMLLALAALASEATADQINAVTTVYGPQRSEIFGISDLGLAVGDLSTSSGVCINGCAVHWNPDGTALAAGGGGSSLAAITPDSTVAVGYINNGVDAIVYDVVGSTYITLPKGDAFGGSVFGAEAHAVSSDGAIIVGSERSLNSGPGSNIAVQWYKVGNTWTESAIGALNENDNSFAMGVTNVNHTIVGYDQVPGNQQAAWYTSGGGGLHALTVNGYSGTQAVAISADGSTIVGSAINAFLPRAVAWTGGNYATVIDLGTLGGVSSANAVSANGSVIVGSSTVSGSSAASYRAVRWTASGGMQDLNSLLTNAGVNMGSIVLRTADAVSGNGLYIGANDFEANSGGGQGYIVYYDGSTGGVTTTPDQQSSFDHLQRSREAVAVQQDAYSGLMIGDLDWQKQGYELGAFGLLGSAVGGARGRAGWGSGFTLTGGLAGGAGDYDTLSYKGILGAVALRYDFSQRIDGLRPFVQASASLGELSDLEFTRNYANGAGSASGLGTTDGRVASLFARLGLTDDITPKDQLQLSTELGERWLNTGAYEEVLSASNPFPAAVSAGTDSMTVGKVAVSWSHSLTHDLDFTLRGAFGSTLGGSSGLSASVSGVGAVNGNYQRANWGEAGIRVGYRATERVTLDAYAAGIAGQHVDAAGHVGVGVRVAF